MPDAIALGPFLVRTLASAVMIGALVAVTLATPLARRAGLEPRGSVRVLEVSLLAALLGARAAHVFENLQAYTERPWTALFLWQPGYSPGYGIAFGVVVALLLLRRQAPAERTRGLAVVGAAGVGGITVGAAVFAVMVALAPPGAGPGARLPDFVLQDLQGREVRWSDNAGRPVILNFWATWCPPCVREMPLLDEVARRYASRGLVVLGVDVAESAESVRRFAAVTPVAYPLWMDPPGEGAASPTQALFDRLGGVGLPTTVFVAADGTIAGRYTGELPRALLYEWAERLSRR